MYVLFSRKSPLVFRRWMSWSSKSYFQGLSARYMLLSFCNTVAWDSPWVSGFPPGGCQQSPETLQSSAGCRKKAKWKMSWVTWQITWSVCVCVMAVTHSDAGVISSYRNIIGAGGWDQTHSQHHQSQTQQRHRHPQGRFPPPQVLTWGQTGAQEWPTHLIVPWTISTISVCTATISQFKVLYMKHTLIIWRHIWIRRITIRVYMWRQVFI